ncbi:hypothetical protein P12x_004929 [Tundrisphaera lichenicola]|uniref:hypothetical protein n=1 Tax=Tundrisphaera lichenicola TaxID=2029860 RepID=UPI003EBB29B9
MMTFKKLGLAAFCLSATLAMVGCEEKGPAEKAGEGVDAAAKDLKDAVDPRGPAEKVGDKVDEAIGK